MRPATWRRRNQRILHDADLLEHPDPRWFDPAWLRTTARVVDEADGRGRALFIEIGNLPCVLRHYHRGGVFGGLLQDRYLRGRPENSRAFREWRLLAELFHEGLPVPRPVAAHLDCRGLFCRANLITERIEGTVTLVDRLQPESAILPDWHALGACLRRFHEHGVFHADLNARNILSRDAETFFLIDFDKGRRRSAGRWQQANLERLRRSLRKLAQAGQAHWSEADDWAALEAGYQAPAAKPPGRGGDPAP
ncbi:MAG: 3-deoxy-D-manno-octulosonic acid kinase [Halothiobacillaceae bacterium]